MLITCIAGPAKPSSSNDMMRTFAGTPLNQMSGLESSSASLLLEYKSFLVSKQLFFRDTKDQVDTCRDLAETTCSQVAFTKTCIGVRRSLSQRLQSSWDSGVFHSVFTLQGTLYIACSCLRSADGDACCAILAERSALVANQRRSSDWRYQKFYLSNVVKWHICNASQWLVNISVM